LGFIELRGADRRRAAMSSRHLGSKFDPLDLEIIERVYEVGCAYIEARNLYRDPEKDAEEEDALRHQVFALAGPGPLEFDALCDKVLASMDQLSTCPEPLNTCHDLEGIPKDGSRTAISDSCQGLT
jgi:hypothetical protein